MGEGIGYKFLGFVVGVAQLVEPWIVIPAVAGSSPVAHPINPYAPIAQLDRAPDFESVGRRFESCWAHHFESPSR